MMLSSTEQNELHGLLRQQGELTQDGCWDAIEVFEKFLKENRKPLSDNVIAKLWGDKYAGKTFMVRNFARAIEKAHGIGVNDE
jgi:hypothetical protein